MRYVYPAIFRRANEEKELWYVEFPDVEGAFTDGGSLFEAIEMAEDVLAGMLCTWEDYKAGRLNHPMKNRIVEPTPIEEVIAEPDEFSTSAFVTLVKADTDAFRRSAAEFPHKHDIIPKGWRDELNAADEKLLAREITLADFERICHDLYVRYNGDKTLQRVDEYDDEDDESESASTGENNMDENIAVRL